jgi:hypothetical protein
MSVDEVAELLGFVGESVSANSTEQISLQFIFSSVAKGTHMSRQVRRVIAGGQRGISGWHGC